MLRQIAGMNVTARKVPERRFIGHLKTNLMTHCAICAPAPQFGIQPTYCGSAAPRLRRFCFIDNGQGRRLVPAAFDGSKTEFPAPRPDRE
jgi:hypothetical protein